MSGSYEVRLLCLLLAGLFLVHAFVAGLLRWCAPSLLDWSSRLPSRTAASILFAARMTPASAALAFVIGIGLPNYLRWEPVRGQETIGLLCAALAVLGAFAWVRPLIGLVWTLLEERRRQVKPPAVALAGLFRSRVLVGDAARAALTSEQLEAALRHERAHQRAHDNLKRLLMSVAPGGCADVERAWAQVSEWAADDESAAGRPDQAVALASALVRVARLNSASPGPLLMTPLLSSRCELAQRVDRLLVPAPASPPRAPLGLWLSSVSAAMAFAAATIVFATIAMRSGRIHEIMETLLSM